MSSRRLLLVHSDPFQSRFYRERLEQAGFAVDLAGNLQRAQDLLQSEKPAVIVIDPLLEEGDAVVSGDAINATPNGAGCPIVVLPTPHYTLGRKLERFSNLRLLTSPANALAELLKTVCELLQLPALNPGVLMQVTRMDEPNKAAALNAAQESLRFMRQDLLEISRGRPRESLAALLLQVHRLVGQTALLNRTGIAHIAGAVEVLVYSLAQSPDRLNPLTLNTLGQATDFLASLLLDGTYSRVPEIGQAHIMVVEDEAAARDLIIASMEMVGLQASGADTPHGGMEKLETQEFDLIFLDINLPEMNGFELCNKVRALPLHERTPIVFLTGMTTFQNRVQSSLSGGNDFIGKPFNVAELGVKALMWVMKGRLGLN